MGIPNRLTRTLYRAVAGLALAGLTLAPQLAAAAPILNRSSFEGFTDITYRDSGATTALWERSSGRLTLSDRTFENLAQTDALRPDGQPGDLRLLVPFKTWHYAVVSRKGVDQRFLRFDGRGFSNLTDELPWFKPGNTTIDFLSCNPYYCLIGLNTLDQELGSRLVWYDGQRYFDLTVNLQLAGIKQVRLGAAAWDGLRWIISGRAAQSGFSGSRLYTYDDKSFQPLADLPISLRAPQAQVLAIAYQPGGYWLIGGQAGADRQPLLLRYDAKALPFRFTDLSAAASRALGPRPIRAIAWNGATWLLTGVDRQAAGQRSALATYDGVNVFPYLRFDPAIAPPLWVRDDRWLIGGYGRSLWEAQGISTRDLSDRLASWPAGGELLAIGARADGSEYYLGGSGQALNRLTYQPQRRGLGQSLQVNPPGSYVANVQLEVVEEKPTGSGIRYQVTANGRDWQDVQSQRKLVFSTPGPSLRWRAELTSGDSGQAPAVRQIRLNYQIYYFDTLSLAPTRSGRAQVAVLPPTVPGGPAPEKLTTFLAYQPRTNVNLASGLIIGSREPGLVTAPRSGAPRVRIWKADGTFAQEFLAYGKKFLGGVNLALGDVDGDGYSDIITAPRPGGGPHVRVFGSDLTPRPRGWKMRSLGEFFAFDAKMTGGVQLAAGDLTGDGAAEIIAWPERGAPDVRVWTRDLVTGAWRRLQPKLFPFPESYRGGLQVAVADFAGSNGQSDRRAELVITNRGGLRPEFRTYRYSDASGQLELVASTAAYAGLAGTPGLRLAAGNLGGSGVNELVTWLDQPGDVQLKVWRWSGEPAGGFRVVGTLNPSSASYPGLVNVALANLQDDERDELALTSTDGRHGPVLSLYRAREQVADGQVSLSFDKIRDLTITTEPLTGLQFGQVAR